jgi:hypothetical protein
MCKISSQKIIGWEGACLDRAAPFVANQPMFAESIGGTQKAI